MKTNPPTQSKDREEIKRNLQVYRGWVSDADAEKDLEYRIDEILDSLKQSLVAEMPPELNYHEAIGNVVGHDDKELENYDKGFNKARRYFLQAITKVFDGRM
jgi:hypothetical protein